GAGGGERLLLVRLAYRDHRWRKWSFPGGFVDEGESLETALSREVSEEIGLVLKSWRRVDVAPVLGGEHAHIGFIFLCNAWEGEPSSRSRELSEVSWVDRQEFLDLAARGELAYPEMRGQVLALGWPVVDSLCDQGRDGEGV
ncbi:MAG: NUDIX hydrolase, partial [Magnetococcales bacterium]|nr:NUDIX hydrolase [Magnetococcales bacterium]